MFDNCDNMGSGIVIRIVGRIQPPILINKSVMYERMILDCHLGQFT